MPRILVADDHASIRRLVREVLETEEGWEVCGDAATGREAVEIAEQQRPEIVVLDFCMPELNGLEAARQILDRAPQTGVVILTLHESEELTREVLASGARACVSKTDPQHLVTAVRKLLQENHDSSRLGPEDLGRDNSPDDVEKSPAADLLTGREREVVRMLAKAKNNWEIAAALSVSVKTVEADRAAIMRKLRIDSILDLLHYAVRKGLVQVKPRSRPANRRIPALLLNSRETREP